MCTPSLRVVLLSVHFLCISVWGSIALAQDVPQAKSLQLPWNVQVSAPLQSVVETLLQKSATIRRQSAAIGRVARVRVAMNLVSPVGGAGRGARATVRRYEAGFLNAVIDIPAGPDLPELIAHEFEHVLEQIEGLNLSVLSRMRSTGVVQLADGSFETERAHAAGRAAAMEATPDVDPRVAAAGRQVTRVARAAWHALGPRTR